MFSMGEVMSTRQPKTINRSTALSLVMEPTAYSSKSVSYIARGSMRYAAGAVAGLAALVGYAHAQDVSKVGYEVPGIEGTTYLGQSRADLMSYIPGKETIMA